MFILQILKTLQKVLVNQVNIILLEIHFFLVPVLCYTQLINFVGKVTLLLRLSAHLRGGIEGEIAGHGSVWQL